MTEPYTGPRLIRVFDLETTGTQDDADAEVIELGRLDVSPITGDLVPGSEWRSFANPMDGIPPVTRAVHHIRDEEVAGAPPARELWDLMFEGLGEKDVLCAHNAKFEKHFCPPDYRERQWIDTFKVALIAWPDAPGHSNQVLRYWLGVDAQPGFDRAKAEPPHRALPDSYVTAFILRELLKVKTVDEMLVISSYPARLRQVSFGEHRGKSYADVPSDYLRWIIEKTDMDEDRKFTARYWLQKRRKGECPEP